MREGDDSPPPNSIVQATNPYRSKRLLIETNIREAADWLKQTLPPYSNI